MYLVVGNEDMAGLVQVKCYLGRKKASFSKKVRGYITALKIFQIVHNFIDIKYDRQSPAMLESVTDHLWSWGEFLSCHHQL